MDIYLQFLAITNKTSISNLKHIVGRFMQLSFFFFKNYLIVRKMLNNIVLVSAINSVQFSHWAMSNSLRPHETQLSRPPCPSQTPRVYSNSCPSSRWCHPPMSSSVVPFSSCTQSLQHQRLLNESTLLMRWPKYWSFSFTISPSNEHPGLISFGMDWLDLLAVQGTLKSLF